MFNWLKKIQIRKLIKLVVLNDLDLKIILGMQKIGFEQKCKSYESYNSDSDF